MTGRKLQGIYLRYREGEITNQQAQNELWDVLFRKKRQLLPDWMIGDSLQDFMVFVKQKLLNMLENYDAKIAAFPTFFFGSMSILSRWWYSREALKLSKDACCIALLSEGTVDIDTEDTIEDASCQKTAGLAREANWVYKGKSDKKCQIRRDICLVLALKSCIDIDDTMIEKVAFETGVDTQQLRQMIWKARASMKKKIERVEKLILRRNFAYFRKKYIMIKKADAERSFCEHDLDEKLQVYERKWKAAVDLIAKQRMTPTNDAVAQILQMSPKRVSFLLDKAKTLLTPSASTKKSTCL